MTDDHTDDETRPRPRRVAAPGRGVDDRVVDGPLLDLRDQLVAAAARRTTTTSGAGPDDAAEATSPPAVTELASRRRTVPTWLTAAAVIPLLAVVAIVAWLATTGDDVAADVNVERVGDSVSISIDDDVTPAELETALDDAGVNVTVTRRTTGPSLVNRFVGIVGPPDAVLSGGDGTSSAAVTFRSDSKVELMLGVPADGDAPYDVPPDATAPGEPLAGLVVNGRTVAEARAEIDEAVGGRVEVQYRTPDGRATTAPEPASVIASTRSLSPTDVVVVVIP